MRPWEPTTASRLLMQRLNDGGLPARVYTDTDGRICVHAGPPAVPAAGVVITVLPGRGSCRFVSDFGNVIGDTRSLAAVVSHVLWLFGLARRYAR